MFEIYGTEGCTYCSLAKELLDNKHIEYTYINVSHDTQAMKMFRENSFKTVPQIFLDNKHLGGYTELREYLNRSKV